METQTFEVKQPMSINRTDVEAQENKIRLVDSDEDTGLSLFCYTHCSNDEDDFVKQCRGLVYHGDTLIMKAFSYTPEYKHTDIEPLEKLLQNFSKWTFFDSYEGSLLRLFHFSGKWYLTTHRKLNAFRSKWSSRDSFGTLFKRAVEAEVNTNPAFASQLGDSEENVLEKFYSTLNKNMQYMFLLRNSNENRIVCNPPSRPTVYHVGTFESDSLVPQLNISCGLLHPKKLSFLNIDQLLDYINTKVNPFETQGIVCYGPNNSQVKILHEKYQELFRVRGNEPSIKFRYLQVRMDRNMVSSLYSLYPEFVATFDEYEEIIYDIAKYIHSSYVKRFIKKNYVTVPREEFQVMSECHSWHLQNKTKEKNIVTLERVIRMLNNQFPTNLNRMIHRFYLKRDNNLNMKPRSYKGSATNSPALTGTVVDSPSDITKKLPPPLLLSRT